MLGDVGDAKNSNFILSSPFCAYKSSVALVVCLPLLSASMTRKFRNFIFRNVYALVGEEAGDIAESGRAIPGGLGSLLLISRLGKCGKEESETEIASSQTSFFFGSSQITV